MNAAAGPDPDLLSPLDPVRLGRTTIAVDRYRPVAALLDDGSDIPRFATWSDAPLGRVATSVHLLPAPSGVWICYRDNDALVFDPTERTSLAVHLTPGGETTPVPLGTEVIRGSDSLGVWSSPDQQQKLDDDYAGGDVPSGWSDPMVLTRTRLDGTRDQMAIDRFVYDISEVAGMLRVLFAPTPPIATRTGSSVGYSYPLALMELDEVVSVPASLVAAEHPSRASDFRDYTEGLTIYVPREPFELPPLSLEGVQDARWPAAPLTEAEVRRAIHEAERRFEDLDRFWVNPEGTRPLAHGVSEGSAHSEGDWPNTRLVVRFRHPYFPGGWIERRLRIFDDAGRISMSDYAAIHLMEDIATAKFPPLSTAVDGILVM